MTSKPSSPLTFRGASSPWRGRSHVLVGALLFALATALYASTMATSFVPGDSANYLNLANTGELTDRGNGVPLYITLLNAVVRFPLPFALSDGVRCNLLTILIAAVALLICYTGASRLTRSTASAAVAVVTVMVSGMIWRSTAFIMPHVTLVLVAAVFVTLLVVYDETRSRETIVALGLTCGLGFGLMPNALLFLPVVLAYPRLSVGSRRAWNHIGWAGVGCLVGIAVNVGLIAAHEAWSPTVASADTSVWEASLFYLRGGEETSWYVNNVSPTRLVQGVIYLPLEVAADFEIFGSLLALLGFLVGWKARPRLHASLAFAFLVFGMWVGTYPGDTRQLHGVAAYPIAALWVACGAHWLIETFLLRVPRLRRSRITPSQLQFGLALTLVSFLLAGVAGGKLVYRDRLCSANRWYLNAFCQERIPERQGDTFLRRAENAIAAIPEGAMVFAASWDAMDQMNYFIRVHRRRADLDGAYDFTKLTVEDFLAKAQTYWSLGKPVFLFGEWNDVELWSPHLLVLFEARPHGEFVFELLAAEPSTP